MMDYLVLAALLSPVLAYFTMSCYRHWSRRHEGWAPPPPPPDEIAANDPYRAPVGDVQVRRPAPRVVHAATAVAGVSGGLMVVCGAELLAFAAGFGVAGAAPGWFPLAPMAVLGAVALAAGLQVFRAGPLLLAGDAAARRAAARAAAWATGLGVVAFAILFLVLGGACAEHDGRLCLALLLVSIASLAVAGVCRGAHEAIPEPDGE